MSQQPRERPSPSPAVPLRGLSPRGPREQAADSCPSSRPRPSIRDRRTGAAGRAARPSPACSPPRVPALRTLIGATQPRPGWGPGSCQDAHSLSPALGTPSAWRVLDSETGFLAENVGSRGSRAPPLAAPALSASPDVTLAGDTVDLRQQTSGRQCLRVPGDPGPRGVTQGHFQTSGLAEESGLKGRWGKTFCRRSRSRLLGDGGGRRASGTQKPVLLWGQGSPQPPGGARGRGAAESLQTAVSPEPAEASSLCGTLFAPAQPTPTLCVASVYLGSFLAMRRGLPTAPPEHSPPALRRGTTV